MKDIVTVRFREHDGKVSGQLIDDGRNRTKIAFVRREPPPNATFWSLREPLFGEKWHCIVRKDSEPKDPANGFLVVDLLEPLAMLPRNADGEPLLVSGPALDSMTSQPEILGLVDELAEKIHFPRKKDPLRFMTDFGRPIGFASYIHAGEVSFDQTCLFAFRRGCANPSRVVRQRPGQMTSTMSVFLAPHSDQLSRRCFSLESFYLGLATRPEPWESLDTAEHVDSLAFWSQNAFWHDPRCMDDPFESSWKRVLETRRPEIFKNSRNCSSGKPNLSNG